jgi:hypothetical protein
MKISLDYRNPTPSHCEVAVFVNNALAGVLTLRREEVEVFNSIVQRGADSQHDEVSSQGEPGTGTRARQSMWHELLPNQ